ncbi:hypothetical protein [Streptomyces deccanensis]|uniref:hypothetical protein n=1 Tax=Streptomyces deccanensis TaxID=424188 RepID=UPI001EFBDA3B|nr:hypothetical protein [Streptomyces deccanensis]ULR52359.1 hypothetical protein L3078_25465 [Streptomyces deccanensis]
MGRLVQTGIAAGAALLLTACGGGAAEEDGKAAVDSGGKKKVTDVKAASLAQKGSLTVAWCHVIPQGEDDDDALFGLTLRSYSVKDGSVVAERHAILPTDVTPKRVCDPGGNDGATWAFNKDLSLIVGIKEAEFKERAGAYDLTTGEEVSPPPADEFTERPDSSGAAFHPVTGLLWVRQGVYEGETDYATRDAKKGYSTEKRLSDEAAFSQDATTTATARAAAGSHAALTPNGSVEAWWNDDDLRTSGLGLERVGDDELIENKQLDDGPACRPAFWRTNTSLVCGLREIVFSSDYKSVVSDEELVPANDRDNGTPLLSPDGKGFAFISEGEGDRLALFRADFTSGGNAQPVKVADLEAPLDGSDDHIETLVRWN